MVKRGIQNLMERMLYGVLAILFRQLGALHCPFLSAIFRSKKSRPDRRGFKPKVFDNCTAIAHSSSTFP